MEENCIESVIQVDVERLEPEVIIDLASGGDESAVWGAPDAGAAHQCPRCGKLYKNPTNLQLHLALKHPGDEGQATCPLCDKTYASALSLQKHTRYKHSSPFNCGVCYRRFASAELLSAHERACSRTDAPCERCGKVFASAVALRNHNKYMHPAAVDENKCDLCRRTFRSSRGLANHMGTVHPPGTHCAACDRSFTSVAALVSHNLHKHTPVEHRCSKCAKVFASNRGFELHYARKHLKKYMCGLCRKGFDASEALVEHVMADHTE